jgi:hypothetical protein
MTSTPDQHHPDQQGDPGHSGADPAAAAKASPRYLADDQEPGALTGEQAEQGGRGCLADWPEPGVALSDAQVAELGRRDFDPAEAEEDPPVGR